MKQTEQRTALFIDGANLHYMQKKYGWEIDFEKLYEFLSRDCYLYNAFYYTAIDKESSTFEEMSQFIDQLAFAGYTIRSKAVKIIKTKTGTIKKGNLDIEIVIDMFNTIDLYDRAILFSGDSDFERAIELLRTHGKEIFVVSSKGFIARELSNAADKYIDLQDMRKYVEKSPAPKPEEKKPKKRSNIRSRKK